MPHDLPAVRHCARCGAPLRRRSPASLCGRCILDSAIHFDPQTGAGNPAPPSRPPVPTSRPADQPVGLIPFGDYLLEREIGHGGMGVVYRARQRGLGRTVALKLLLFGRHASAESMERFRREAQSAAGLRHPHIVAIHEVGTHEGQPFYSMEYVDGQTLAELLQAGPLQSDEAATHARTIAVAVQYAHSQGVLHRDLKPANILVDPLGELRLTDFGLAKRLDGTSDLTETGRLLGTPNYLAPEATTGHSTGFGAASDVYAIGAIFYELLTGRPPFLAPTLPETLLQVRDADPVSPRTLNPSVPVDAETICLKALEKNPAQRYASAQELADELDRYLSGKPIRARRTGWTEKVLKWGRRQPRLAAAVALATLALLALLATLAIANFKIRGANREANRQAEIKRRQLVQLQVQTANHLADDADSFAALLRLVEALRLEEPSPIAADVQRRRIGVLLRDQPEIVLMGFHDRDVVGAEFSPDSRRLLTTGEDRTVRLWSLDPRGSSPLVLSHTGQVVSARFSPDGRRIASFDQAGVVRPWDAESGRPEPGQTTLQPPWPACFDFHPTNAWVVAAGAGGLRLAPTLDLLPTGHALLAPDEARLVRFSPDGACLAVTTREYRLLLWTNSQWEQPPLVIQPDSPVTQLRFSRQGHRLVTVHSNNRVRIWSLPSGTPLGDPLVHASFVYAADLSPDSARLATAEWQNGGHLWEVASGRAIGAPLAHEGGVRSARFSPDGQWLATASWDRTVRFWNPLTGTAKSPILRHGGFALGALFSPDSRLLATVSQDTAVRVWRLRDRGEPRLNLRHPQGVDVARFSPDGSLILAPCWNGQVQLWDRRTGELRRTLPHPGRVNDALFDPAGKRVVTACMDGVARVWSLEPTPTVLASVRHQDNILRIRLSPDGRVFSTASADRTGRLWRLEDGQPVTPPLVHAGVVEMTVFSPDGRRVATASRDRTARIWDASTGTPTGPAMMHESLVRTVAFSPDGRLLLTAHGGEGMIACAARIWNADTGAACGPVFQHLDGLYSAVFSPDGRRVATAGEDNAAFLWDARTGELLTPPLRHRSFVREVAFSPDGRFLATASFDGTARVWESETGEPVSPPLQHGQSAVFVAWSNDGNEVISTSFDGTARVWDLSPTDLPLAELQRQAELLSSHRLLSRTGMTPLVPAELRARWIGSPTSPSP